ncbi:MAG TPA: hypothetical protein VLX44_20815, partial [Xanthobacteraceae bacterium]|nr:hypothetical protein [Xanthobacteraceae bacterium]
AWRRPGFLQRHPRLQWFSCAKASSFAARITRDRPEGNWLRQFDSWFTAARGAARTDHPSIAGAH